MECTKTVVFVHMLFDNWSLCDNLISKKLRSEVRGKAMSKNDRSYKNGHILVLGKAREGMSSNFKFKQTLERVIKIEDVSEFDISTLKSSSNINANFVHVILKDECPAFSDWAGKLSKKDKLPRGKYFEKISFIRSFYTANKFNGC